MKTTFIYDNPFEIVTKKLAYKVAVNAASLDEARNIAIKKFMARGLPWVEPKSLVTVLDPRACVRECRRLGFCN